jgi:two-component system, sensor histidine kinase and response regulator
MDIRTLSINSSIVSFVVALMLWFLYRRTPNINGPKYWVICNFLNGSGMAAFSFSHYISPVYSLLLANILNVSGICLFLVGVWAFKGEKIKWKFIFGSIFLMFLGTLVFMYIFPNSMLRQVTFSLVIMVCAVVIVYELFGLAPKGLRTAYRVNGFIFVLLIAGLFIRGILAVLQPQTNVLASSFANNLFFIIVIVVQMSLTFGIFLLVNFRMISQMEETLASKGLIYSILAHDLKGHIGVIDGFAGLLSSDNFNSTDKQKRFTTELKKLSASTYSLMDDLLDWARSQSRNDFYNPKVIDLREMVDASVQIVNNVAQNKQIGFNYEINERYDVYGDERMLSVIIRNLLMNAVKYSFPGGKIRIEAIDRKTTIDLLIKDEGIGFSREKLANLFAYGKNKPGEGTSGEIGYGFGLFVCKDFIQLNHGKISFDSREGAGTTVTVSLPKHK